MTIQVREAVEADLPAIARVGAAAFHPSTDAISRSIFPPHLQPQEFSDIGEAAFPWRLVRKSASMKAYHGLKDGSTILLAVDGDEVVGFSLWEAPEGQKGDEELERLKHWAPDPAPPGVDQDAFRELRRVLDQDAKVVMGGEETKTWNLDYLGVDPKHQRRGIGKKLLQAGTAYIASRAAAEGDAAHSCYLVATAAGRPLYEVVGFKVVNEVSLFGHPHHSMLLKVEAAKSEELRN